MFQKRIRGFILFLAVCALPYECLAQVEPGKLQFSLPKHSGSLTLDQKNWKIVQLSAKNEGGEFGIRAIKNDDEFLGFLFLSPKDAPMSAITCREVELKTYKWDERKGTIQREQLKSLSGVEIAESTLHLEDRVLVRAFVASEDLCGDLQFNYAARGVEEQRAAELEIKDELCALTFDPHANRTFMGAFAYATVAFDHYDRYGAVHNYNFALELVFNSPSPKLRWTGFVVNQLSIAVDMENPKKLRKALEKAIAYGPVCPDYYLMLARLDADENKVNEARTHLQQYFDDRQDKLPGELFPDLIADKSLLKLKTNEEFWAFVESINTKLQ